MGHCAALVKRDSFFTEPFHFANWASAQGTKISSTSAAAFISGSTIPQGCFLLCLNSWSWKRETCLVCRLLAKESSAANGVEKSNCGRWKRCTVQWSSRHQTRASVTPTDHTLEIVLKFCEHSHMESWTIAVCLFVYPSCGFVSGFLHLNTTPTAQSFPTTCHASSTVNKNFYMTRTENWFFFPPAFWWLLSL